MSTHFPPNALYRMQVRQPRCARHASPIVALYLVQFSNVRKCEVKGARPQKERAEAAKVSEGLPAVECFHHALESPVNVLEGVGKDEPEVTLPVLAERGAGEDGNAVVEE